jgi:glycosyltransferase involved in cell wall biosynthesis
MVELSIIVPTYKEIDNIADVVKHMHVCLEGVAWELIFVDDDSPDGTGDQVRAIARTDPHVRCLQRMGRRGLSSACIEGMLSSSAPYLAVMDADLQHDETLLPTMLNLLRQGDADIVIGSRYIPGGSGPMGQVTCLDQPLGHPPQSSRSESEPGRPHERIFHDDIRGHAPLHTRQHIGRWFQNPP